MEKEVNLEEILLATMGKLREMQPDGDWYSDEETKNSPELPLFIEAMREACRQVLELASENASINGWGTNGFGSYEVDKQSILNTINKVK
jgi:hypothetical protein